MPTFIIRNPDDTHRLIIEKPIILEPDKDRKKFIEKNMVTLVKIFEKYIQEYPCHFAMTINAIKRREEQNTTGFIPLFKSN